MPNNKIFLVDTNVLIHDPQSIFTFENTNVYIPSTALEELDQFKRESSDRGRSARNIARELDVLRSKGSLKDGVKIENGSIIKIAFPSEAQRPLFLKKETDDNEILFIAYELKNQGNEVIIITKDINARIKADVLGIRAEDYLKGRYEEYDIYKGWQKVGVPAVQLTRSIPEDLIKLASDGAFQLNEYVLAHSNNNEFNYKIFRYMGNKQFKFVVEPQLRWPIHARNPQQLMTLDLLFDPNIQMVSLVGPAGTGKTFLALLAGLHEVLIQDMYSKVLISRPVIPLGPDIGFLPGDIQEKLRSWMQPMYDNMGIIVHSAQTERHTQEDEDDEDRYASKKSKKHKHNHKRDRRVELRSLDEMIHTGKVAIEAITYMRGRSIPYQYILIDEAQNLSPHEVKTIVTRVGEGSKIVLAGDPYQIDSPYLDFSSNGLVVASNAFRGQSIFGTVFLETSERSELSRLAAELL